MKTRYLAAIFSAMLLFAVAHAQTGNGFPNFANVPKTGHSLTIPPALTSPLSLPETIVRKSRRSAAGDGLLKFSRTPNNSSRAFMLWSGDTIAGFRIVGQKMNTEADDAV